MVRMKALLKQQGLAAALEELHVATIVAYDNLEDVLATLNSRELQKMTEAKGDGGEGLYVRGRSGQRDMEQGTDSAWSKLQEKSSRLRCYICQSEEHLKRDYPRYNHKKSQGFVKNEDQGMPCTGDGRNLVSLGTLEKEGFTVKMQSGKIKVIKGSLMVLSGTRRSNCVYTLDGQAVTSKTLNGRKQLGEYQTGWKIKTGFFGWLASIKQGMLEPVKVKCIFLGYRKGFNESGEYKKTFIGSGVGTGSVQVLQGVEFEVELQEDHTFEVEPHGIFYHVAGSQEVQTQDLIYYHSSRDRKQHLAWELFSYIEDNDEGDFAVAAVEKIYAHESLTFNNTVACKVIFKWKAGLKDDMDAQLDVYVLSNGCRKCSDDNNGYYWEYTPVKGNVLGMEIVKDQSGNTLRVSQSRFYNGKLVHILLEGRSILLLKDSLSGDCDVEKNGKWSCIYAVGSQEYQVVCTRPDIASADVDRSLSWVDQSQAVYMTFTKAAKEAIWLKGLSIESRFELKIVAGIATGALSKAIPGSRFQH
ncbi:hypothetical protein Tco_0841546 [Tanacetum coccineum]|uniref:Zinc finger, CCHC-type n=1 Tax=Tanacetum coccineum TaxID=301880 RepID=A0ABQ5AYH6_9ASTR